jgi:hypothetical protein
VNQFQLNYLEVTLLQQTFLEQTVATQRTIYSDTSTSTVVHELVDLVNDKSS